METQVLASLRFVASGCFYQVDADVLGVDQSTVSRAVYLCQSILPKKDRSVRFPFIVAEKNENKRNFYQMGGFPSCMLWDGFHLNICVHRLKMIILSLIGKVSIPPSDDRCGLQDCRYSCKVAWFNP